MYGLMILKREKQEKRSKAQKASSDCLLLRLPFEFSRAWGMCLCLIVLIGQYVY